MKRKIQDEEILTIDWTEASDLVDELVTKEKACEEYILSVETLLHLMKKEKKDIQKKLGQFEKMRQTTTTV